MPPTNSSVNKQLHDAFMTRGVMAARTEAQVQNDVLAYLNELTTELRMRLSSVDWESGDVAARLIKLDKLEKSVQATIEDYYSQIEDKAQQDVIDVANAEVSWLSVVNDVVGIDIFDVTLSKELLKSLTSDIMIQGAPSSGWWAKQSDTLTFNFMKEMRLGIGQGETLNQLIQRVRGTREGGFTDGIMYSSTRDAEALVRTSVQTVMNDTRMAVYKQNSDVLQGVQWLSALDFRVCIMCRLGDGGVWDLEGNPLNDIARKFAFRIPPIHFRDRCILSPALRSWEELAQQYGGNTDIGKQLDSMSVSTRASIDGQVPDTVNFSDWITQKNKTDPAAVEEMMGSGRYQLWQSGKISLGSFLDDRGNPLPISKLA
jgi:hypothetical protein